MKDLLDRVPIGRRTVFDLMARGRFPRPVELGVRATAWLEHEIDEWLDQRIAERDQEAGK